MKKRKQNTKTAIRVIAMAVVVMILFSILVMFTGCGTVQASEEHVSVTFEVVCKTRISNKQVYIVTHAETGVLYIYENGGYSNNMTVMLDADGTPLLYEDYIK